LLKLIKDIRQWNRP